MKSGENVCIKDLANSPFSIKWKYSFKWQLTQPTYFITNVTAMWLGERHTITLYWGVLLLPCTRYCKRPPRLSRGLRRQPWWNRCCVEFKQTPVKSHNDYPYFSGVETCVPKWKKCICKGKACILHCSRLSQRQHFPVIALMSITDQQPFRSSLKLAAYCNQKVLNEIKMG